MRTVDQLWPHGQLCRGGDVAGGEGGRGTSEQGIRWRGEERGEGVWRGGPGGGGGGISVVVPSPHMARGVWGRRRNCVTISAWSSVRGGKAA